MSDLAKQIRDNITASIDTLHRSSGQLLTSPSPSQTAVDAYRLNVTVQSDAKTPPFFRSDHTDKFLVHEWEDIVMSYLHDMNRTEQEKFDFAMSRLLGKERDVVRVPPVRLEALTSSGQLSVVFDILNLNFSELT